VSDGSLEPEQRLHGHLVDAGIALPVYLRKVFDLELLDEITIDAACKQLPQDTTSVNMKYLLLKFLLDQTLCLLVRKHILLHETFDDHGLLLSLRCFDAQKSVYLVDEVVH
jgi:hypothetical protein